MPGTRTLAYVGCRTTRERGARGLGLSVFEVHAGRWTQVQLVDGLVNPCFLALDRSGKYLYAVHGHMTDVTSFRREADGKLVLLGTTGTGGANPVHLAPDPTNRFMLAGGDRRQIAAVRGADGARQVNCGGGAFNRRFGTDLLPLASEVRQHEVGPGEAAESFGAGEHKAPTGGL